MKFEDILNSDCALSDVDLVGFNALKGYFLLYSIYKLVFSCLLSSTDKSFSVFDFPLDFNFILKDFHDLISKLSVDDVEFVLDNIKKFLR